MSVDAIPTRTFVEEAVHLEECCEIMHNAYEAAAPAAGWKTQEASRKAWVDVPESNKVTMRAAVEALLDHLDSPESLMEKEPENIPENIPGTVRIGSVTYTVTTDPDAWVRYEYENKQSGFYGHTDNTTATILLNPDSTPDVTRLTLWHEIQHALFETVMGSPNWLDLGETKHDREEAVIRAIESPTLLVLRDNPDLVAYLTADH